MAEINVAGWLNNTTEGRLFKMAAATAIAENNDTKQRANPNTPEGAWAIAKAQGRIEALEWALNPDEIEAMAKKASVV